MDDMAFSFDQSRRTLEVRLAELEAEHRKLDTVVDELNQLGVDMLKLQRLKRQKLRLRDEINRIRMSLYPNIIA